MIKLYCSIFLFFSIGQALCQADPEFYMGSHVNAIPYPAGFITSLPGPPPGVEGSVYLNESWQQADIFLPENKVIEDVSIRFEIKQNYIEISHDKQIKVLPFDKIKAVKVKNTGGSIDAYIPGKDIVLDGVRLEGVCEMLVSGEYNLLVVTRLEELAPNYNAALDTGTRDIRILQKKTYYIMRDNVAVEVITNKKKFANDLNSVFKQNFTEMVNRAKLTKESGMIDLITEVNTTRRVD